MSRFSGKGRAFVLIGLLIALLALFFTVGLRSGPLAAVPVTVATVEERALVPTLFGIGTVEARYTYRIGPSFAGRVGRVDVHVGDRVRAGQLLGEIDPVDLEDRIAAQAALIQRAQAAVRAAEALLQEASATQAYTRTQKERYEKLLRGNAATEEVVETKQREYQAADARLRAVRADLDAGRQELLRSEADYAGLRQRRREMRLVAPVDGLVTARAVEPGSTVVPGQAVVEMIDPASLWIHTRFDQLGASALRAGLPARIDLRSRAGQPLAGQVTRVEPLADAVTEELLAKAAFAAGADPLPPVGELAEVTVTLPALPLRPVIPNAAVRRFDGQLGVWLLEGASMRFVPVRLGGADLEGQVQIMDGLKKDQRVVLHSQRALTERSRIKIVERLPMPGGRP